MKFRKQREAAIEAYRLAGGDYERAIKILKGFFDSGQAPRKSNKNNKTHEQYARELIRDNEHPGHGGWLHQAKHKMPAQSRKRLASSPDRLNEDEVLDALEAHLENKGWRTLDKARGQEQGFDQHMRRADGAELIIEGKGGTSGLERSAAYGKPYGSGKLIDVTSKGLLKVLTLRTAHTNASIGLVLEAASRPKIEPCLELKIFEQSGIGLWLVSVGGVELVVAPAGLEDQV